MTITLPVKKLTEVIELVNTSSLRMVANMHDLCAIQRKLLYMAQVCSLT